MKFFSTILAAISLLSAADACKCWNSQGRHVSEYTHACCTYTGGIFSRDDDNCDGDIFDKLDTFAQCCENLGTQTDCECPDCDEEDERRRVLGLGPMTEAERMAFAMKSAGKGGMSETGEKKKQSVRFFG